MSWDPVRQYGEALSGDITDWHPPMMQWVWRGLLRLHAGPAPMMLLELVLYWGGLTLFAATMWRRNRPRLAWWLLACGLFPLGLVLTGTILKDSLMAGALVAATSILVARGRRRRAATTTVAVLFLFFAAALRFNAFTACLPLLVALLPQAWRRTWPRLGASCLVATAALMLSMPVVNWLIGATRSGVQLSLVIFDLGGITKYSGINVFPPELKVADAVRVNHGCYTPVKWDSYSDWVDPECPLGFSAWNDLPVSPHPYASWLRAVLAHPFAYARHRLVHFAINTRLVPVADTVERPVPAASAPNVWGFHVTDNPGLRLLDTLAVTMAHTPLGWPIVWIALALGAVIVGRGGPNASLIVPLALSSLLYGTGYLAFSVAAELRYHLWTGLAALLATVLVAGDGRAIPVRRLCFAYAPTVLVVLAGAGIRLFAR